MDFTDLVFTLTIDHFGRHIRHNRWTSCAGRATAAVSRLEP